MKQRGGYRPKPWERVERGVVYGPGYAYDLVNDDLLFFVAPSRMRRTPDEEDAGSVGPADRPCPEGGRTRGEAS